MGALCAIFLVNAIQEGRPFLPPLAKRDVPPMSLDRQRNPWSLKFPKPFRHVTSHRADWQTGRDMNIQINAVDYWVGCNTKQMAHRFYGVARVASCICESSNTLYSRMNGAASFQSVE